MRKKAIAILLLIPFVVSVLAFVTSTHIIRLIETDITGINWTYRSNEGFLLDNGAVKLEAEPVYNEKFPLSDGNNLTFKTDGESDVATVEQRGEDFYFIPKLRGRVDVICQNEKGNVSKKFTAIVFDENGGVVVNFKKDFSQSGIDDTNYVGLYDMEYEEAKKNAYYELNESSIQYTIETFGISNTDLEYEFTTDTISVDTTSRTIDFKKAGEAQLKVSCKFEEDVYSVLDFNIVDGVNIYSYDDLLMATNYSDGLNAVMRVNLESYENTFDSNGNYKSEDTKLFGHITGYKENGKPIFNFINEIFTFETTYNHDFLDKWNKEKPANYDTVDYTIKAGINLKKDFYGNGYVVNLHNLAYPSEVYGTGDNAAKLDKTDLFRGPRLFVSLGNPKTKADDIGSTSTYPIYALYGQDNIGFVVTNDNTSIIDAHIKNCEFGNNLTNLEYAGTVVEVMADNVLIRDSILENGRNVIRAFSTDNLVIDNCLIQNSLEYLVKLGSNKYNHIDKNKQINVNGVPVSAEQYLAKSTNLMNKDYMADTLLTNGALFKTPGGAFFGGLEDIYTKDELVNNLGNIKEALSNTLGMVKEDGSYNYDGTITINNTFFDNSGLSAICLDTMANGSYLQSEITSLFGMLLYPYIQVYPDNMSMTSYPVLLNLTGDNRFYDWKKVDDLDYSVILSQDIANLIIHHGRLYDIDVEITDDDYLPLRKLLKEYHNSDMYKYGEDTYINPAIFKMGGGLNLSQVIMDDQNAVNFQDEFEIDPYTYSLGLSVDFGYDDFNTNSEAKYATMKVAMLRASSNVFGFNSYKYTTLSNFKHPWFNENPNLNDLRNR